MEAGAATFFADCSGGLFAAVSLDVGEDYGCAFGGALASAAKTYALGGSGDEDDFVLEAVGHGQGNGKNLTQRAQRAQSATEKRQASQNARLSVGEI